MMCCKTQKLKVQSQYHMRKRWNIDEWPKNERQKETKLEEFRSFRTSDDEKEENKGVMEKKLKLRIVLCV